jgi:Hypothetical protein (DUF2513)
VKLDMDLVRTLMLTLESGWQPPHGAMVNPEIPGYDELTIDHHVHLIRQAGLVEAVEADFSGTLLKTAYATQLTWAGHQALASIRNDTVWAKTKTAVAKAGGATMPLWIDVAAAYVKEQLGLK